mmetsp:Transcript_52066/g.127111  ORF Transcript_52066/g.127111 Transcript_52066/m.127111 type:complete len:255 (-) Transcript_52066:356-1120(-)
MTHNASRSLSLQACGFAKPPLSPCSAYDDSMRCATAKGMPSSSRKAWAFLLNLVGSSLYRSRKAQYMSNFARRRLSFLSSHARSAGSCARTNGGSIFALSEDGSFAMSRICPDARLSHSSSFTTSLSAYASAGVPACKLHLGARSLGPSSSPPPAPAAALAAALSSFLTRSSFSSLPSASPPSFSSSCPLRWRWTVRTLLLPKPSTRASLACSRVNSSSLPPPPTLLTLLRRATTFPATTGPGSATTTSHLSGS